MPDAAPLRPHPTVPAGRSSARSHPAPVGLGELGATLRADWRATDAEWDRAAAQQWVHGRRTTDLLRELAARGDRVAVLVAGRTLEGAITGVGDDRLDLEVGADAVSVHLAAGTTPGAPTLPVLVRRTVAARAGGVRLPSALVTFRARLLELERDGAPVRVGVVLPTVELCGRIAVGRDHVLVRAEDDVAVPTAWVGYVVEAEEDGA